MRIISILLVVLMLVSLVACGSTENTSESAFENKNSQTESSVAEVSKEESTATSEEVSEEASEEASEEVSEEVSEDIIDEPIESIYDALEVGKLSTPAVVDGVVSEGEYATCIAFNLDKTYWNFASTDGADAYDITVNIGWDETYFYTAVSLRVGMPRTYDNTDYLSNRPYIFDRRHIMSAIISGDPTDPKYQPPAGEEYWDWAAAYDSGLGSEWTITAQPDGKNISADHFGEVTKDPGYEFIVAVSQLDYEVYEQKIPWTALAGSANFNPVAGSVMGYAFSACCEEIDITLEQGDDPDAVYANFGGGISNGKNFAEYVGLTLVD